VLPVPLLREGQPVGSPLTIQDSRERVTAALTSLPWDGLRLSPGEPAIPTLFL
jgi:nicotinate phosphoribosyltransferase